MKTLITTIANFILDIGNIIKFIFIAIVSFIVYLVVLKSRSSYPIAFDPIAFAVSAVVFIVMCVIFISSQYELYMLRDKIEALKTIRNNTENMQNSIPGTAEASSGAKYFMGFAGKTINDAGNALNLFGEILFSLCIAYIAYVASMAIMPHISYCEYREYKCSGAAIPVFFLVFGVMLVVRVSKFVLSKYLYYLRQEEHDCLVSIAFNLEIMSEKIQNISFIQKPLPPGQKYIKEFDKKIQFGKYPFYEDGREKPIDWIILDKDSEGNALLISDYCLDNVRYNARNVDITWENSTIRQWLNNDFLNKAFTKDERDIIIKQCIENKGNEEYNISGGINTTDNLFLLSIESVRKYFEKDESRIAYPTPYAKSSKSIEGGVYVSEKYGRPDRGGSCWWWLRSPGFDQNRAVHISTGGGIDSNGNFVYVDGGAVRPALIINLNNLKSMKTQIE